MKPASKRHRNMLASVAVCGGLLAAYYLAVGQARIPPDTHIVLEHRDCAGDCPAWQVDILADGTTWYQGRGQPGLNGIYSYKLSKFALRRVLRVFARAHYFDQAANGYAVTAGGPICTLTLTSQRQKMSIRHACSERAAAIAKPGAAVVGATQADALAKLGRAAGLKPQASDLPRDNIVRPLVSAGRP
ncbi:MAG: hypothetical protein JF615_06815 [Asticcacaulis sp.]|nr:hypothetical protein [Asticcacaulis sp.]